MIGSKELCKRKTLFVDMTARGGGWERVLELIQMIGGDRYGILYVQTSWRQEMYKGRNNLYD